MVRNRARDMLVLAFLASAGSGCSTSRQSMPCQSCIERPSCVAELQDEADAALSQDSSLASFNPSEAGEPAMAAYRATSLMPGGMRTSVQSNKPAVASDADAAARGEQVVAGSESQDSHQVRLASAVTSERKSAKTSLRRVSVRAAPPKREPDDSENGKPEELPATTAPGQLPGSPGSILQVDAVPIDLATALQLTTGRNPQVAFAQERIQEAYARQQTAEVLWLPSLRAGANYNKHEGKIQDVAGNIIDTSRGSVYTGLGAMAVGAGSPSVPGISMNFQLKEAAFAPRIAEQVVGARMNASRATTNDLLMESALAYTDLLEAVQVEAVAAETLRNARKLAELTESFAKAGQGLESDADRANTELTIREVELRRAREAVRVASIRLSRLLSRDQSLTLVPQEPSLVPIDLVVIDTSLQELVAIGLSNRPELTESRYLVGEAVERLRREQYAPLVPSVLLGLSYGGNGGGLGGDIENFGDRMDFDAAVFWEVRNLGFGERNIRNEAGSLVRQTRFRQVQVMDQVASDVAEAHAQVVARREQIELAEPGIKSAIDSYRRNSERIRDAQGLPIEAIQSIQALDQARRLYVRAVADYNRAQFRLHRALGWPIAEL